MAKDAGTDGVPDVAVVVGEGTDDVASVIVEWTTVVGVQVGVSDGDDDGVTDIGECDAAGGGISRPGERGGELATRKAEESGDEACDSEDQQGGTSEATAWSSSG